MLRPLHLCLCLAAALLLGTACDDGFADSIDDVTLADPTLPVAIPAGAPSESPDPPPPGPPADDASAARSVTFPTSGRLAVADSAAWFNLHVDADASALSASVSSPGAACSPGAANDSNGAFEIALYAGDGTTLAAYQRRAGCARLQVSDLAAGDYYLRVSASRSTVYVLAAAVTP
jgi:hypothetical protein